MNHSIHSIHSSSSNNSSIVLKQLDISPSDIETEDVIFYAKLIGIDPISEPELLWIAKAGLLSSLPDGWQAIEDQKGRLYYYDKRKKKSSWEHPSDPYYRFLVQNYRHFNISGSSSLTLDENNNNNNNNPKLANSVSANSSSIKDLNHNGNSIVMMNEYSTGSNGFSSSLANLHFFDDENDDDDDDQNPDQENELAEADRQQQQKSIPADGGGIHNQWVTITTTANNSNLPSSNNIDLQSKSILKLDDDNGDGNEEKVEEKEEEEEPEASIDIESVELEIENPVQSLEEISEDVEIEEIMVVDSDEDHQSVASSKETDVEVKKKVEINSISLVPGKRKIENNNNNDDGDVAGHDNDDDDDDDDVLIHSDLMNNLIQEDLFNKTEDEYDDHDDHDDRYGNHHHHNNNHRPRSAIVNSGNNIVNNNVDEKASAKLLSIVQEESDDDDEPETLLLETEDDATSKAEAAEAVDSRRMSQMGPINHQKPENEANREEKEEKEEDDGKTCILERINEQHQSLNSDGIKILLNNVKKEKEQLGKLVQRTESTLMPNDDDIDASSSLLADDYDQEEFDSESNSRINENERVSGREREREREQEQEREQVKQRFNEITEQMQVKIIALREQIRNELNECNESLRKQMNEEIVSLNQRIESVEKQNNNSIQLLSRKIEELNLSLASEHPNNPNDFRKIQPEMLNNQIEDLKCKVMKELNENIEQKLMEINVKVEKTIKQNLENSQQQQQLTMKQEQILQKELSSSSLKSESINRDQIIEIAKQLYDRMNDDFRSAMIEIRQLCLKSNDQVEMLRNIAEQDRNFTKVNILRIDKNITQLELKCNGDGNVVDALNKNKSTVTNSSVAAMAAADSKQRTIEETTGLQEKKQKKLIQNLIDQQMKSLNSRLNELNDKIESIMQQINSKLKLYDSFTTTIPKRGGIIQLDSEEIESNYTNQKMLKAIGKPEKEIGNQNRNIDPTAATEDVDGEDSNSKIKKQVGNDDDDHHPQQQPPQLTRNNDSTVYHKNKNNDAIEAEVEVVNCSNFKEKNERKESSSDLDHEHYVTETNRKNRHQQLLEQCIDLNELLKLFMLSNPNTKPVRKCIEPKRKYMMIKSKSKSKSKSTNQIKNPFVERIQSEDISSSDYYLSEPTSSTTTNDNQSLSTINNDQFQGKKKKKKPQWSRSTPDLNPSKHHRRRRRDYPFGQAIIMPTNNNNGSNVSKMNRSYANLSSSYGSAIRSNDVKSNSLLTTIKQTSNQLKQELKNLETLGNYSSGYQVDNNDDDDDDWLKSLNNDSKHRRSQIDSQSEYNSDNIRNHQEDQFLMFRLRSIRDSVNDRLTKISLAIQQQKITQI